MSHQADIDSLKTENARLKGALTKLEQKVSGQSGIIVQVQVERNISRRTIRSQETQIANLVASVESENKIIKSLEEEIARLSGTLPTLTTSPFSNLTTEPSIEITADSILTQIRSAAHETNDEVELLKKKLKESEEDFETLKQTMMPCYKVGFWTRQRNREEDWVRRGGQSTWFPPHITCDCSTHYADPLSDASILYYTDDLQLIDSYGTERWAHYEQVYTVPPDVVLDNHHFRSFLNLIQSHANMQRYIEEGSTDKAEAAAFLKDSKKLIEQVHPLEVFKYDEDLEKDEAAYEVYQRLDIAFADASLRHRTFLKPREEAMLRG